MGGKLEAATSARMPRGVLKVLLLEMTDECRGSGQKGAPAD